ncbi:MAG TPA: hypothetical protein VLG12_03020 [Candidatus Saccharimonadales bacterium]|nr:hypothetical protein [Candidatus Saccharimonadales bacterium]
MLETLKNDLRAKITLLIFLLFTISWIIIKATPDSTNIYHHLWGDTYGIMAFLGGICGLFISKKWGGTKSVIGNALLFFSLGLLLQEFGQITYSYYVDIEHIGIPYPSLGDIGYFGSIPAYIIGIIHLAKASGVRIGLKSFENKAQAIIIPIIILILGYFLFLQKYTFDWSNPMKIFLDFGYPMGEAIYISFAILTYILSRNILGGIMKNKVLLILLALCFQFLSDYTFLYNSSKGTYEVAGYNDYIYFFAYFIMTLAIIQFNQVFKKIRSEKI